jgi:RND superfamily putative drug exporter
MLAQAGPQLDAQQAQIDAQQDALDAQQQQVDAGLAELEAGAAELESQGQQLELGGALLEMAAQIRQVSQDGSAAIVSVVFENVSFDVPEEVQQAVLDEFRAVPIDGVDVDFSSSLAMEVPSILGVGELAGVVVAAVVLLVMLGTLVAAGLPILTAGIGVGIGALGTLSLSGVIDMVSVTPVLGVMLGLAVGIDYSLFILNRHRRQLKQGYDVEESIGLANGTSGNAVVFAGAAVLIALLALNVTGIPFLGLMGTVGAASIAIAVLVAITLTPALLGLLGTRVLRRRERAHLEAAAPPATKPLRTMSTTKAVVHALVGVVALVLLALPATSLRIGLPDGSSEARSSTTYQAYTTVAEKFGPGQNGTLLVIADVPAGADETEALAAQAEVAGRLFQIEGVAAVAPVATSADGALVAFQVVPQEGPNAESTEVLVNQLRDLSPLDGDIPIAVAGQTSGAIDVSAKLADALPIYLAVVVGLSLIILMLVFRSIFVPLIATLGFVLSYFAALGGVVAIYQWGWLGPLFDVHAPGPVLNFLPTVLVGILFGLAMDYQLFLGSGMREAYAHGASPRLAIVQGVRAGRAVVTAAALIMASVFGGFIFAESTMIRPIGFALAFGVLVDAFVVRMLVVPALMHLVGNGAWWLPRWLDRLLPDVDVEGAALERRHPHVEHTEA